MILAMFISQPDPQTDPGNISSLPQDMALPSPASGDSSRADGYLNKLTRLIQEDKLNISHTDLKQFELASMQDHYRIDLGEYEVEISHSKQPDTGKDFYIILFNNLKKIQESGGVCTNRVILAYIHLTHEQFVNFKNVADEYLERKKKKAEEKRFAEAMKPIDNLLEQMATGSGEKMTEEETEVNLESATVNEQVVEPKNEII